MFILLLISSSAFASEYSIELGKMAKIDIPNFEYCIASIKNQSGQELEIAVRDLSCGELLSGLGREDKEKKAFTYPKKEHYSSRI